MAKTIVGLFDDFTAAVNTAPDLVSAGIAREDISVVAHDTKGEFANFQPAAEATTTEKSAGAGAAIGGIAGLLLGPGSLAIPGVGPIIAAGPLVGALVGATLGAATGGLLGAFHEVGVPVEEARYHIEGLRRGGTVLTVKVADNRVDRAVEILKRHRAVDIGERAAQWRQSGWTDALPPSSSTAGTTLERSVVQPTLDMDDGRVIFKKETPTTAGTRSRDTFTEGCGNTSVTKVNSRCSPKGKRGQKYLAAGVTISMRLWEDEQPGKAQPPTQREYETVGYVIKGCAELQLEGQTLILEPGDSWVVPKGAVHRYKILEPFTAIEATCPPAEVHGRGQA